MSTCGGYELIGDWKPSNQGFTAIATKGGKKFFLKKYNNYIKPVRSSSMKEVTFNRLNEAFENYKNYRIAINVKLKEISGPGGNIIYPTDWFVDDNFYVEATEFVEGLIEDEAILRLDEEKLNLVMKTATSALSGIHRQNIVHSDLKLGNIVAAKNPAGNIVAKLIDFDKSYFGDRLPSEDDLGGSQNYMSPELTWCMICEFDGDCLTKLSTKSDIFSLGILFYNYLTNGEYPRYVDLPEGLKTKKSVYAGEVLSAGGKLAIEKKKIKQEYLRYLIGCMLQPKPEDRPTAQEVLATLNSKSIMPLKDESQVIVEKEGGVTPSDGTRDVSHRKTTSGTSGGSSTATETVPTGYCEPWPEHAVAFDTEKMKTAKYVAMEQTESGGMKLYKLYQADGKGRPFTLALLKALGFVKGSGSSTTGGSTSSTTAATAPATVEYDRAMWPEDAAYELDLDAIKRGGYEDAGRGEKGATKGYNLKTKDGGNRFFTFALLKQLRFVKLK